MIPTDNTENACCAKCQGFVTWDRGLASKAPGTPAPPGSPQSKTDCYLSIPRRRCSATASFRSPDTTQASTRQRPAARSNTLPDICHTSSTLCQPRRQDRSSSTPGHQKPLQELPRGPGTTFTLQQRRGSQHPKPGSESNRNCTSRQSTMRFPFPTAIGHNSLA